MNKEALHHIFDQRLFFPLFLIIFVYFVASYVNMRLGFEILGVKVGKRIWPSVFIMVCYTLYGQNLMPMLFYGIAIVPLVAFLYKVTDKKVSILKALWASILVIFSNAIGFILVITPSCLLSKSISLFFTKTLYEGNITATLIETIFPALGLLYLPRYKSLNSLIPSLKDKNNRVDIFVPIAYGTMLSAFYLSGFVLWIKIINDSRNIFWNWIYQWITMLIIVLGHYFITRSMKKSHESQQRVNEERIAKLEQQNLELAKLNEYLETRNSDEIKEIRESIHRMENNNIMAIKQIKSDTSLADEVKLSNPDDLSEREITLIRLIALNKTTDEIMAEMHLGDNTVRKYISNLYGKLGLKSNRVDITLYAVKHGIIKREEIELNRDDIAPL